MVTPASLNLTLLSNILPSFVNIGTQSWIVSQESRSSIHRFFDSSPLSPSNHYLAYTELNGACEGERTAQCNRADIVTVDLKSGSRILVASTHAWDTQVGAHVQWGRTDSELFFNSYGGHADSPNAQNSPEYYTDSSNGAAHGAVYNLRDGTTRYLQCPVYHVSPNGRYSASPNLYKIGNTQRGYGINIPDLSAPNVNASAHDGLFITSVRSGRCRLVVTLHQLAVAAGLDTMSTPTYGFHTKWSSDGQLVMFVVRTLELPVPATAALASWSVQSARDALKGLAAPRRVRVQHLFVVDRRGRSIRHVVSWASRPYVSAVTGRVATLRDGNHPNWVWGAHRISMNLQPDEHTEDDAGDRAADNTGPRKAHRGRSRGQAKWSIVEFDVSTTAGDQQQSSSTEPVIAAGGGAGNDPLTPTGQQEPAVVRSTSVSRPQTADPVASLTASRVVYPVGTGHPNYHPSGRYVITDAYVKEHAALSHLGRLRDLWSVPLRLIDLRLQEEVWLLQMQVESHGNSTETSMFAALWSQLMGRSSQSVSADRAWRCDLHPAWSRDGQWVTVNGRAFGGTRQVVLIYLGSDLGKYFTETSA